MAKFYQVSLMLACVCGWTEGGKYRLEDKLTSYDNVSRHCQLATPDINYTNIDGWHLNVDVGRTRETAPYWVGYVKVFASFQYEGCTKHNLVNGTIPNTTVMKEITPGKCYTLCTTAYIGLSNTTCYCIRRMQRKADLLYLKCNQTCKSQPGIVCGGSGGFISVYSKIEYFKTSAGNHDHDDPKHFCLSWDSTMQNFTWSDCDHYKSCLSGNSHSSSGTWSVIMNDYLNETSLPKTRANFVRSMTKDDCNVWIGEIRSQVIAKNTDTPMSEIIKRGYVQRSIDGGPLLLKFEHMQYHHKRALCLRGKHASVVKVSSSTRSYTNNKWKSTVTTALPETHTPDLHTDATTSHVASTPVATTQYVHITTESTVKEEAAHCNNNIEKGLVVIIAAVCGATILIHVGICILQRRCKGNTKAKSDEKTPPDTDIHEPNTRQAVHNYFVLEPPHGPRRPSAPAPTRRPQVSVPSDDVVYDAADTPVSALPDDVVLKPHHGPRRPSVPAPTRGPPVSAPSDDVVYDAADTPACALPDDDGHVYSVADSGVAYSRASVQPDQGRQPTDNIYNVADNGDTDDVYDHVGGKPDNRILHTDNIYNTAGEVSDTQPHG